MASKHTNPDSSLKLILVYGLPGSGKTYFSRAFSDRTGIDRFGSDEVRTTLGLRGNYSKQARREVYDHLLSLARQNLFTGKSAIIDANFTYSHQRETFKNLAAECRGHYCPILLKADENISLDRLLESRPFSEADADVYRSLRKKAEYNENEALCLQSTNDNLENMMARAIKHIAYEPL